MMTGKLLGRKFPGVKRSIQTGKESVPLFSDGENGRRAAERAQIEMPRTGENSLNLPLHISIPLPTDHMHQNQAFFGLHRPLPSRLDFRDPKPFSWASVHTIWNNALLCMPRPYFFLYTPLRYGLLLHLICGLSIVPSTLSTTRGGGRE